MNGVSSQNPADLLVAPGGVIGILGGGQLGRMLALAAARLGILAHIYSPDADCPAAQVSAFGTVAPYDDREALMRFARSVDVVTFEFENVPVETVSILSGAGAVVRPGAMALEKAQDRLHEKQFINSIGAKTAPHHPVDDLKSLQEGLSLIGRPAILKTRRLGYDGKGQTRLTDDMKDLPSAYETAVEFAWAEVGAAPSILEGYVPFACEISVIAARGANGRIRHYEPGRNEHHAGILKTSKVPSELSDNILESACSIASTMMEALNYVGVIGVEFFVLEWGELIVNEFAPRVHNSGHWTMDACAVDQFEQHIRAVAGWPLGSTSRQCNVAMENLIGEELNDWPSIAADESARLHIYGKDAVRAGRKMAHVNRITDKN